MIISGSSQVCLQERSDVKRIISLFIRHLVDYQVPALYGTPGEVGDHTLRHIFVVGGVKSQAFG